MGKNLQEKIISADLKGRGVRSDETWIALRFDAGDSLRLAEIYFHPAKPTGWKTKHKEVTSDNFGLKALAIYLLVVASKKLEGTKFNDAILVDQVSKENLSKVERYSWVKTMHGAAPKVDKIDWIKNLFGFDSSTGDGTCINALDLICRRRRPENHLQLCLPLTEHSIWPEAILVYVQEKNGDPRLENSTNELLNLATKIECSVQRWNEKLVVNYRSRPSVAHPRGVCEQVIPTELLEQELAEIHSRPQWRARPTMVGPAIQQKVFNPLIGLVYAEWIGSDNQWQVAVANSKMALNHRPDNLFLRAALLWSILTKGDPTEIVQMLKETGAWVQSEEELSEDGGWQPEFLATLEEICLDGIDRRDLDLRHLEHTLARASLLRYIKRQGFSSQLKAEFANLGAELERHRVFGVLLTSSKAAAPDTWLKSGIQFIQEWAARESQSALARLCLIWFTGYLRQGMETTIQQNCRWLERNPERGLVRWSLLWLAGLCPDGEVVDSLIETTKEWLSSRESLHFRDDELLVWMGLLWVVGTKSTPSIIREVIAQTSRWLELHPNDDVVRVFYLLFLIRRQGTRAEIDEAVAATKGWLRTHQDEQQITSLAAHVCESAGKLLKR